MQIGVMNHPARDPIAEIEWIGQHGFDFVDFTLEPPAADPDVIDPDAIRTPWTGTVSAWWRIRRGSSRWARPSPASGRRAWASSAAACGRPTGSGRRS